MQYAGIDVGNKTSAICVVTGAGEVVVEATVASEEQALHQALSGYGRLRVVLEASPLAEWLARVIEDIGHEVVVIDARSAKRVMAASKKTDARDAQTLAQMARAGWYTAVHRKSPRAREMRTRLQSRQALVSLQRTTANQLRGLLRAHGIRLGAVSKHRFAARVREVLAHELPQLAWELEALVGVYEQALEASEQRRKHLERQAPSDAERALYRHLQSVPGVGPLVSRAYVATIDDPRRFANENEISDYIGLAPRVYQSGETLYHGRITGEGDRLLRWHLVEAAHAVLVRGPDCALKRWGRRLAQRKGPARAKVALARKIAVILRRIWLTGEPFQAWPQQREPAPA